MLCQGSLSSEYILSRNLGHVGEVDILSHTFYSECSYVALIALSTSFSMAWYKIIMKRALSCYTLEFPTYQLYFRGLHTRLRVRVYTDKIETLSIDDENGRRVRTGSNFEP